MAQIIFTQYKDKILEAIQNKVLAKGMIVPDPQGYTLIEGFFNLPIQPEIGSGTFSLGGPSIPAVSIVGNSTGLIYTFAIKALIPTIEI